MLKPYWIESMSRDRRYILLVMTSSLSAVSLLGCGDPNKSSSPPARTYGAPAARVKNADEYSAPYGVNGNPYYFNHKTEKWVYFDENGREQESPRQPPSPGMRIKKVKTPPSESKPTQ